MKRQALFFLTVVALLLAVNQVEASPLVYVWNNNVGNQGAYDAAKINYSSAGDPDGLLCWAAAAANALAWAGWTGLQPNSTPITTAAGIFAYFSSSWPNHIGNTMWGYDWWFNNEHNAPNTPSQNAGFYKADNLIDHNNPANSVYGAQYWDLIKGIGIKPEESYIYSRLSEHKVVEISIDVTIPGFGLFSHALTAWGMDTDNKLLYYTDSDDNIAGIRSLPYYLGGDGFLHLSGYTNSYITTGVNPLIDQAVRLNMNTNSLVPSLYSSTPVPEPASAVLVCLGLISFTWFGRKSLRK